MVNLNTGSTEKNKDNPFFSLLIPVYNRTRFLSKCIDSILDNDFTEMEIIISDDKSPRISEISDILDPYLVHENISFYRQSNNLGWSNNRNFLLSKARGRYVILLGDDDLLKPNTLATIKAYIDRKPSFDLYCFGYSIIDENNQICKSYKAPIDLEISSNYHDRVKLLFCSDIIPFWIFHPFTICYDRKVGHKINYNKNAHIGDDILFLHDCINSGKRLYVIPEVLFLWRKIQDLANQSDKNLSSYNIDNVIARKNILYILEKYNTLLPHISTYISSYAFRKRFLYDSIVTDKEVSKDEIHKLNLRQEHVDELMNLSSRFFFYHFLRKKFYQFTDYMKLFGFKGFSGVLFLCHQGFLQSHIHKIKCLLNMSK